MGFTLEQFQIGTGASEGNAQLYYEHALAAAARFSIQSAHQLSAWFGTMAVESTHLSVMEEGLFYRNPARLADLFRRAFDLDKDRVVDPEEIEAAKPYCCNPAALSQKLYAGFHGRGAIQLTWEKNYRVHGDRLGFDYVSSPDLVKTPEHAMLTSASFFELAGCNEVASDMDTVTLRVNGPRRLHLAERIAARNTALEVLA